ncbi:GNAT family N-acetyltransferase [Arthrobacter sp. I2-34]|uniref:GNAT family N-acetyltransferase n=1 Tax=Arthrobacter hankyongi TaxID=2904801 RepID=A0ABS9L5L0_9MICC|nr:GNAT family N-acetyltransferase [Arthrobacter hankyongi]
MQHPRLTIKEMPWSNPVGADLRAAQQRELSSRFGTADHEAGPPPSAEDMPVFLIAYEKSSGQPLGCGGLRRLDESTAEIKRVYVVPYARGSGVSAAILAALEAKALASGYAEIRAEAGSVQSDGMRFYERGGYLPIPNFGPYEGVADSHCYAKTIAVRTAATVP